MKNQAVPAFLIISAVGLSLTTGPGRAGAACNAVPDPASTFRGVLGSVDRPFARPGEVDDVIALGSACASSSLTDTNGDGAVDALDFDVTIIAKGPLGGARRAIVVRGAGDCAAVGTELSQLQNALQGQAPQCVPGAGAKPSAPPQKPLHPLELKLPQVDFAGPATIVVTPVGAPLPIGLVNQGCKQHAGKNAPLICIDELFVNDGVNCGTLPDQVDPLFKEFVLLPPENHYELLCTKDKKSAPHCVGNADKLVYTVNGDGDVILHMRWGKILRPSPGGGFDLRDVLGSSAVEAFLQQGEPIDIPSSAFLKSFNPAGISFTRQPLFIPVPVSQSDRPNELTLRGDVDKGRSVLYLRRRLPWGYACAGGSNPGQACEPNPQTYPLVDDCPGGTCTQQAQASLFTCTSASSSRAGAPCTRPRHCPGGECTAGSTCTIQTGPVPKQCNLDSDCLGQGECGPGLFEFRDRVTNGIGELPRLAGEYTDGKFEGVCDGGLFGLLDGSKCAGTNLSCFFGSADCIVFRAEADAYP